METWTAMTIQMNKDARGEIVEITSFAATTEDVYTTPMNVMAWTTVEMGLMNVTVQK
jgi:hypothetical protein